MASTNQSPFYMRAEEKFLSAQTDKNRLEALDEMIKECPKHKSSENMLANLKTRKKKLLGQIEKAKKSGKGAKKGIKKEDMQAVIIGNTNTGKSTLLTSLTNAHTKVSQNKFATTEPVIGMMEYKEVQIQLVEIPAIESEFFDKGIIHTADTILIVVNALDQILKIKKILPKTKSKKIIVLNKFEEIDERKTKATLQSKKHNFVIIDTKTKEGLDKLKRKIFQSFDNLRIFTKEPGKERSNRPMILKPHSTVKDVAEKILTGFSKNIKEIKIWGPSSKFSGQKVGLKHLVKDLDVVEFRTK